MKAKSSLPYALARALGFVALTHSAAGLAYNFAVNWGGQEVTGVLNTSMTLGAAWRMEERADDLVGKANLNPDLCGRAPDGGILYQSCQGLFRDQTFTAERLVSGKGQFTSNADDGNWNYDKHDLTQAPFKLTQDLTLNYGNFGFFVRGLYFYDFINENFREFHPNRVTRENMLEVGELSTNGDELGPLPPGVPLPPVSLNPLFTARTDSTACPAERNPTGEACGIVYGKGGVVRNKRKDKEILRQIGSDLQLLDLNFYGELPLPFGERTLNFKLGRQILNWGESTALIFDSLSQANPINVNNFFRVGMALEEVFVPVNMLSLSTSLTDSLQLSGFYQLEWEPLEAPAPGSFYSPIDIGTNNAVRSINLGFGSVAEDPDRVARLLDNPLSGLTNTSAAALRLLDREPDNAGQYGLSLRYYADWLNNGTEFGFYYMNYHSRAPFASVISVPEGCAKHTTNTAEFVAACPDTPLFHSLTSPNDPLGATSDAVNFDKIGVLLEYPEDIQMLGVSFNTTFGDIALQGELAYRPDAPLQVDSEDLALAGFGPAASNCHLPETGCVGSTPGVGVYPDGSTGLYQPSDYVVDADGTPGAFNDTYDLVVGHMAGSGRFFPSFIIPWRGGTIGLNPGSSYIRGWEYFDTYQFNLGGTYVMSATHPVSKLIRADQIIALFETGATWVPDLPELHELQLEAPGTFLHASAGADGSGANYRNEKQRRQACSTNPACSFGPDGLRFNPHQEDLDLFPDDLSMGYALIAAIRYESVMPGISLQPFIIFKHDAYGTSPGLVSNFVEGRKILDTALEIRYKSNLSFNAGYQLIAGGGKANLLRDRDSARFFVKYQF
jgi:hypothetical protein